MYVQIIKSVDNDRDTIELVEDLNSYAVNLSVRTSSVLNQLAKNGTIYFNEKIDGTVKINLTVQDARDLVNELSRAIALSEKTIEKKE